MRELGVLLDRDADGEFLHFYTEVLGGRVFFEVVQRVGGYEGYGEVNAPDPDGRPPPPAPAMMRG